MRNRDIQRKIKKLTQMGIPKSSIRIVLEKRLNRTSEYCNEDGPIVDETPWLAIKPGKRIVIKN